jgi:uncharacterized protein (TIRG00374 family)
MQREGVASQAKHLAQVSARWVFGLGVAGMALLALLQGVEWRAVLNALRGADYLWLAPAVAGVFATLLTRAHRWRALLQRQEVGFLALVEAVLMGQVVNAALPVLRSGDLARAIWLGRRQGLSVSHVLGTIMLGKVWDVLILVVSGVAFLALIPVPDWFVDPTWALLLAVGLAVTVLFLGLRWQNRLLMLAARILQPLPFAARLRLVPRLNRLIVAVDAIRQPRLSVAAALWTLATWTLGAWVNWTVMRAFGFGSVPAAAFLVTAILLGGAVVPTPGQLGVFEGICIVSLAYFGVARDLALAYGVILHLTVLGPPLITAAVLAIIRATGGTTRAQPAVPAETPSVPTDG